MRWRRLLLRGVALLLALAVAIPVFVAGRVWYVARQDDRAPSDVILVLGTAQYDGRPSSIFTARLEHALVLYEQDVAPMVLTVGGARLGDRFTEAEAAADYLVAGGLPAGAVTAVGEGSDTLRSLQAAARVMRSQGWSSAVLVTDPWHVLRARSMARDVGIDAVGSPTRQGPAVYTRRTQLRYITRETAALLSYHALHATPTSPASNFGSEPAEKHGVLTQGSGVGSSGDDAT